MYKRISLLLIAFFVFACEDDDPTKPINITPVINSIKPSYGSVYQEVTISGKRFGSSQGKSKVSFNSTDAEEYNIWNNTGIKVIVPIGATTGMVSVTVKDQVSNEVYFPVNLNCEILGKDYSENTFSLLLYDMNLLELPDCVGNLTKLIELHLANNLLTTLPESIGNLTILSMLYAWKNQLTSLPESIGNLTKLRILSLSYNKLTILPESIGNLTNLRDLPLRENQLSTLPQSIGNLTKLEYLRLNNNLLTTLPESIGNLPYLTVLELRSNQLTTLPESIGNLTNLASLDLDSNQLTTLPESIRNLTKLWYLYLRGNNFSETEKAKIESWLPKCIIQW
ncbi:IPT/TIG domain-containing protein [Bacteroidota bacterium]